MTDKLSDLLSKTDNCLVKDQFYFRSSLKNLKQSHPLKSKGKDKGKQKGKQKGTQKGTKKAQPTLESLRQKITASAQMVENRRAAVPVITYPPDLPLSSRTEDIKEAITENQVIIVAGETGSGKTTQLPKICLDLGLGIKGMIGHTQPRRLAARTVCNRIADELGMENTTGVGYQVRFQDYTDDKTYIKLMTDGILLAETRDDPFLNKYDTIIIDEAHERSLNIDFLLGYLKRLLPKRPDLKLIVTSATIDVEKFSAHFDNAPIIEVTGRTYPVNVIYQAAEDNEDDDLNAQIIRAIHQLQIVGSKVPIPYKDILIFLSGEKEIREAADAIRKDKSLDLEVLPLYARLSYKEQYRVFQSHRQQRVVLATNVAETSLTVPGIGYVIDAGLARISRYSVRSKIQRLPIEAISRASADQRAGRCGRLCPGTCVRLYSEADYLSRPEFTDTEITRTNLASVILQMLMLRLGEIESFPFVDPPQAVAINDGFQVLEELGAVNSSKRITQLGRKMARFPVDPRFGRILLAAAERHCLSEILIIVSALSIQDPRERPLQHQQAADALHARFKHPESDFLAWVNLWNFYEEERQDIGRNRLGKFCRKNFLSWLRMGEWRDVHRQLRLVSQDLALPINKELASYDQIHQSLLGGLVSHVANKIDDNTWLGARNRKFRIFPGSNLHGKKYPWILAAELVETSQLFARMNARVEPEWIEKQAGPLLKYNYSEPHWEKRRGKVVAFEKVTLYGLVLAEKRKKVYSSIDPEVSREIFIRDGLVRSEVNTKLPFYRHNTQLVKDIESMEDKTRRKDMLVRDEDIVQLYNERLPGHIVDQASLERWAKTLGEADIDKLYFDREALLAFSGDGPNLGDFPDQIQAGHLALDLDYQFEPGTATDGISVDVPVSVLMQLKEEELDWLVPGMLEEKCIAMVKALPKALRRNFVPVPDVVAKILPAIKTGKGDLKAVLAHQLHRHTGVSLPADCWQNFSLPDHLVMNINVLDQEGRLLDSSRNLTRLKNKFADNSRQVMATFSKNSIEESGLTDWTFGALEEVHEIEQGGLTLLSWPALIDEEESVSLKLLDSPYSALKQSRAGIARLFMLKNRQQLKFLQKNVLQDPIHLPAMKPFGGRDALAQQLVQAAYQSAFQLDQVIPRDKDAFEQHYEAGRALLSETSMRLEVLLYKTLKGFSLAISSLKKHKQNGDVLLQQDINNQLDALLYDGFLAQTPLEVLKEYPRYMEAIVQRLEKYPRQQDKDRQWSQMLQGWWDRYKEKSALYEGQYKDSQALEDFRWMLEELRVSLFAQALGTRYPVSEKRLEKAWAEIE